MGLFFTLLYILTAYLTPPVLFGPLGEFHAEVILAVPTIVFSILNLRDTNFFGLSQTWGAVGLVFAVAMSLAVTGWIGGAPVALMEFLPNIIIFFFIVCNCKKKSHLQMLFAVLFFVVAFDIVQSQLEPKIPGVGFGQYYMVMYDAAGAPFYRIHGLGVIGDPNDFGQFMMGLLPVAFFSWARGKSARNFFRVYLPVGVILTGISLTRSRGALLGLGVLLVVAFRKKIGLIPSAIGGGVMLVALMAAGFTGGRDVSAASGEDRMEAWSTGLQLIRSHPLFGVGYGHFTDYYYITAHNTIVVCAAEVGLVGFFFWVMFMLSGVRDCYAVSIYGLNQKADQKDEPAGTMRFMARHAPAPQMQNLAFAGPKLVSGPTSSPLLDPSPLGAAPRFARTSAPAAEPSIEVEMTREAQNPRSAPSGFAAAIPAGLPPEEIRRIANLVVLSLVGLFVTGWFLSRAFAMVFFIYGGVAAVVFRMARESGMEVPRLEIPRALKLSIAPTIVLVGIVYVILRLDHMMPH